MVDCWFFYIVGNRCCFGGASKSNSGSGEKCSKKIKDRENFASSIKSNQERSSQSFSPRDSITQKQKYTDQSKNIADKVDIEAVNKNCLGNQKKPEDWGRIEDGNGKLSEGGIGGCGKRDLEDGGLPLREVSVLTSLGKTNISEISLSGKSGEDNLESHSGCHAKNEWNQSSILSEGLEINGIALAFNRNRVKSLWHMTHRENVDSIIENGILSNSVAYGRVRPKDISDHEVQRWRERVDPFFNKKIHEYVPLYINPRNPMLFRKRDIQDNLCLIEVSLAVLSMHTFIYTDGNAASKETLFYDDISRIDEIPWEVLHSAYWSNYADGKRKRCAEVLIYPVIESEYIKKIHCCSQDTMQYLKNNNIESIITTNLFF